MTVGTKQSINTSAQRRGAVNVEEWNEFDPVANALLSLIEAQNVVQRTIDATCEERDDGTFATDAEVDAALVARFNAITGMLAAQTLYWLGRTNLRENSWRGYKLAEKNHDNAIMELIDAGRRR
jgi:hypothetical protein